MLLQRMCVDGGEAGLRLDVFLMRHFLREPQGCGFSRSELQRLIGEGEVTLNGNRVKPSTRVRMSDVVEVQRLPPRVSPLEPEALPLRILYEDDDCLVINKAAGIVVHPAAGRTSGTVVNAFIDRSVTKEYLALVWGRIEPEAGLIDRPIGRHRSDRKKMSSIRSLSHKRDAITEWRVERYFPPARKGRASTGVSWLRVRPRTGRTHQIRVHLADLGFPVVGDKVYGPKRKKTIIKQAELDWLEFFPRQVLHAAKLAINHPRTNQRMEFFAPLPNDIRNLLKGLERERMGGDTIQVRG